MVKGTNNLLGLLDVRTPYNSVSAYEHKAILRNEVYHYLKGLYEEQYGSSWVNSELVLAKKHLGVHSNHLNIRYGGRKRTQFTSQKPINDVVKEFFDEIDIGATLCNPVKKYIGTETVTEEQFALYSKGLYWMAAYQML